MGKSSKEIDSDAGVSRRRMPTTAVGVADLAGCGGQSSSGDGRVRNPKHPYAASLLSASPKATEECRADDPDRSAYNDDDHEAACIHPVEDVAAELLTRYQ